MNVLKRAGQRLEDRLASSTREEPALKQSNRWMRSVTWALVGTAGAALAWLTLGKTEEIAVVSGKLEPVGQVQEVRIPMGGVTETVLVKEGELVRAGQVLMRLDTEATASRRLALNQSISLKRQQLIEKDSELGRYLDLNDTEQTNLSNNIRLQENIVGRLEGLERQGAMPELQLLQERNRLQETRGKLEQVQVDRARQVAVLNQQRQQLSTDLAQLQSQLSEQTVALRYQEIRSPVAGVVFDLKPKGPGFVAQTSEPVLKIVPQDTLQASVEIPSRQIGFVHVGQRAEISIDSYPSSDFGVVQGEVKRVSSDALPPDPSQGRNEYSYPGLIQLTKQTLKLRDGRILPLQAGMSLQANIKLRSVSYMQLLIGGFRDKADSLRQISKPSKPAPPPKDTDNR
jgi:HlyD family secretion protein